MRSQAAGGDRRPPASGGFNQVGGDWRTGIRPFGRDAGAGTPLQQRECQSRGLMASSLADLTEGNSVGSSGWRIGGRWWPTPPVAALRRACRMDAPISTFHPRAALPVRGPGGPCEDRYLVDSASSHMLVSKIKPCMSKYKQLYGETANGSLNQLSFI